MDKHLQGGKNRFRLARRQPGGSWQTVRDNTSHRSTTSAAREGTEFRVRSRDRAGNTSAWSEPVAANSV